MEEAFAHEECMICLEPILSGNQVDVFIDELNRRSCEHFLCSKCARLYVNSRKCPLCLTVFSRTETIELDNPDRIFDLIDLDRSGKLDRVEVEKGLRLLSPVHRGDLRQYVNSVWCDWDANGDGELSKDEFRIVCQEISVIGLRNQNVRTSPPFVEDPGRFFQFWDEDNNGVLNCAELLRAFIHCFGCTGDVAIISELADSLQAIIVAYDDNGDGVMNRSEFMDFHRTYADIIWEFQRTLVNTHAL
mmetsp:Transcript_11181/g.16467  ORF Transcript_11181/g.16467 Transcript_11181/m.16467 type:complete len:246 (-) Transcript_11181:42-779(-)